MTGEWLTGDARARQQPGGIDVEAMQRLERMVADEVRAKRPLPRLEHELPCSIEDTAGGEQVPCVGAATAVLRLEAGTHVHTCPMHAAAIRSVHRVLEAQEVVGDECPWCAAAGAGDG